METFVSPLHAPSSQTSLQEVLGAGSMSTSEQDMQRQLEEFNRTVTIIFWYKPETEPIRLQQMIPTFPYFQLSRLATLTTDLGLTSTSYLDTYDPQAQKWEQHTIGTVRLVEPQQRLLYRVRRSLLEGLGEIECTGLQEELQIVQTRQARLQPVQSLSHQPKIEWQPSRTPLKRLEPDSGKPVPQASKVHITNGYHATHTPNAVPSSTPSPPPPQAESAAAITSTSTNLAPPIPPRPPTPIPAGPPSSNTGPYNYKSPSFYPTPTPTNDTPKPSPNPNPPQPSTSAQLQLSPSPVPHHPHPPLKRWPNDYTVAELTEGFTAMEDLIARAPNGSNMTQRKAFERVFGSRYVKSTVCRHRGVWKKAKGPLREQFEKMGADERACWGEFIRRIEGRPPAKSVGVSSSQGVPGPSPTQGVMTFHGHGATPSQSHLVLTVNASTAKGTRPQVISQPTRNAEPIDDEPIMASLQKPDSEDESTLQNG